MQTNYLFKIKEFLKRIFSKKTEIKEEKIEIKTKEEKKKAKVEPSKLNKGER